MNVPTWVWISTVVGILAIFAFDFLVNARKPHEPTFRESATWTAIYVSLSLTFGAVFLAVAGPERGAEFFAGYITEYSLSVDNLFVFLIIMTKFAVPRIYQQEVLLIGILIALVLRGAFIAVGAAAIAQFSWVFYLFGVFLVFTAIKLLQEGAEPEGEEVKENIVIRAVRRMMPTTDGYVGAKLVVHQNGRRMVTPMLIVMIAIGSTDIMFALDSIPAIFGLTQEAYIVFTANAFALLGLRQLYFLIGGLLERLVYLSKGLSIVLAFIGVKLVLEALHLNELPFINGGEPVAWAPEIPIWLSLTVILSVLAITTVASLIKTRGKEVHAGPVHLVDQPEPAEDQPEPAEGPQPKG